MVMSEFARLTSTYAESGPEFRASGPGCDEDSC